LTYALVGISMALSGYSYWSLVAAQLASSVVVTVAICALARYRPPLIPTLRGIEELCGFGVGVTLSSMFNYVTAKVDYFVIGRRMDADALGLYTKAFGWIELPTDTISRVLSPILFSSFSALQHDRARLRSAYGKILAIVSFLGFPTMLIVAIVAPEAIALIFGEQWTGAVRPLQIMTLAGAFKLLGPPGGTMLKATGRIYIEVWQQMTRAILLGVGAWFATKWGIEGVAWVVVGTTVISYAFIAVVIYSTVGFGLYDLYRALAGSCVAAVTVGGATFIVRSLALRFTSSGPTLVLSLVAAVVLGAGVTMSGYFHAAELLRREMASASRRF